jgi:tetratricopeptide (TPR) repeat protein
MALFSLTLLVAGQLEADGNKLANEGDTFYKEKAYDKAAAKYMEAMEKYKRAVKEEGIPITDKVNKMKKNAGASFAKAKNWQGYIDVLILDYQNAKEKSKFNLAKKIGSIYKSKKYLNNSEKALEFYMSFENETSGHFLIQKRIGNIYKENKDYNNAIVWYEKSYARQKSSTIINDIASMHMLLKDYDSAIKAYNRYVNLEDTPSTEKAKTYMYMGKLYEDTGKPSKAIENYEKSVSLKYSKDLETKLMVLYFEKGDFEKSRKKAEFLLTKDSKYDHAIYHIAQILYKNGKKREAKAEYQKLLSSPQYKKLAGDFIKSIDSEL